MPNEGQLLRHTAGGSDQLICPYCHKEQRVQMMRRHSWWCECETRFIVHIDSSKCLAEDDCWPVLQRSLLGAGDDRTAAEESVYDAQDGMRLQDVFEGVVALERPRSVVYAITPTARPRTFPCLPVAYQLALAVPLLGFSPVRWMPYNWSFDGAVSGQPVSVDVFGDLSEDQERMSVSVAPKKCGQIVYGRAGWAPPDNVSGAWSEFVSSLSPDSAWRLHDYYPGSLVSAQFDGCLPKAATVDEMAVWAEKAFQTAITTCLSAANTFAGRRDEWVTLFLARAGEARRAWHRVAPLWRVLAGDRLRQQDRLEADRILEELATVRSRDDIAAFLHYRGATRLFSENLLQDLRETWPWVHSTGHALLHENNPSRRAEQTAEL
jgi:hypothetical protein